MWSTCALVRCSGSRAGQCTLLDGRESAVRTLELNIPLGNLCISFLLLIAAIAGWVWEIQNVSRQPWSGERRTKLNPNARRWQHRPGRRIRIQADGGEGDWNSGRGLFLGPDWNRWGLLYTRLSCVSVSVFHQQFYCKTCPMLRNLVVGWVWIISMLAACVWSHSVRVQMSRCPQIINPPSFIPRSCWRREKWPGIHCAYMCNYPMVLGGIVNNC